MTAIGKSGLQTGLGTVCNHSWVIEHDWLNGRGTDGARRSSLRKFSWRIAQEQGQDKSGQNQDYYANAPVKFRTEEGMKDDVTPDARF